MVGPCTRTTKARRTGPKLWPPMENVATAPSATTEGPTLRPHTQSVATATTERTQAVEAYGERGYSDDAGPLTGIEVAEGVAHFRPPWGPPEFLGF